jgi:hypothetical protein
MITGSIDPSVLDPNWQQTGESSWLVTLVEDPDTGELVLPIPEHALAHVGWSVGDTLTWEDQGDGSWALKKIGT